MAVEETQAVLAGLEGAACNPPLAQVEQVGPNLFLAELIGRAAVMLGQLVNSPDIDLTRSRGQPGQGHVLNHPHTQWRHGGLLSLMVRRATARPPARKDTSSPHPRPRSPRPRRSRSVQLESFIFPPPRRDNRGYRAWWNSVGGYPCQPTSHRICEETTLI